MKCAFCENHLEHVFVDLVASPPSNAYLTEEQVGRAEMYYPLKVWACEKCWLVQVADVAGREAHFNENYAYFSSFSPSLLAYTKGYVDMMVERLGLDASSNVVEVASNDGYLLQYFKPHGVPCFGIEPTASTAKAAREKGVETIVEFFGEGIATRLAAEGRSADLIAANNVMAHVPDIKDFTMGFKRLLKPHGTVTVEFQYLLNMVVKDQFDIVYHEHYSYLSLHAVKNIFEACGLTVYDVEEVSTQGGSLRVYGKHSENDALAVKDSVAAQLAKEVGVGLTKVETYTRFQAQADRVKDTFVAFLIEQKRAGKKVMAYGAAAKGTTMLNYARIKPDLLAAVADANPHKQGKYLPGSHVPIISAEALKAAKPDVVVILPWNLKDEISQQLAYVREWGGRFAVYLPKLEVF